MSTQPSIIGSIGIMKTIEKYLYQVGCPILMFLGTVGCVINLIMFTRKNIRKNPCSIYFIAYNLVNLLYIYCSLLSLTLSVGYNIDPSAYNLVICRLRIYMSIFLNWVSPFYLILASIDRILITSSNALTRQRSTRRLAYTYIILGTLFWLFFHSHALILTNIIQFTPDLFLCYHQPGVYLTFIGYYSITKEITALVLLTICGLWSINNIRSTRRIRVAVNLTGNTMTGKQRVHLTSKDRQLIVMLLMDISVYASFSFVFAIYLMYQQITQNYIKTFEQIQIENIIRNICLFIIGIPFCSSCYTNIIASKTFRNEVKKMIFG